MGPQEIPRKPATGRMPRSAVAFAMFLLALGVLSTGTIIYDPGLAAALSFLMGWGLFVGLVVSWTAVFVMLIWGGARGSPRP